MFDRPASDLSGHTDEELRRYRRELERSLKDLAPHAPVRELVGHKLAVVLAEEEARRQRQPQLR